MFQEFYLGVFMISHSWSLPLPFILPPFIKGEFEFSKFSKKRGGSDFCHKMGGVDKTGGLVNKRRVPLTFILTNPFQCYFSLRVWCVCMCVLFIYTISISIIYVSQEEPSLIASNQQIYDFYK